MVRVAWAEEADLTDIEAERHICIWGEINRPKTYRLTYIHIWSTHIHNIHGQRKTDLEHIGSHIYITYMGKDKQTEHI